MVTIQAHRVDPEVKITVNYAKSSKKIKREIAWSTNVRVIVHGQVGHRGRRVLHRVEPQDSEQEQDKCSRKVILEERNVGGIQTTSKPNSAQAILVLSTGIGEIGGIGLIVMQPVAKATRSGQGLVTILSQKTEAYNVQEDPKRFLSVEQSDLVSQSMGNGRNGRGGHPAVHLATKEPF